MRRRIRIWTIAVWGMAVWAILASLIALYLAGNLTLFGHWWWWDFIPYATTMPVLRVLAVSGVAALAIVGSAVGIGLLSTGDLLRTDPSATLYGKTNWASRAELDRGGFRETHSPK